MQPSNLNIKIYGFLCAIIVILSATLLSQCSRVESMQKLLENPPVHVKEETQIRDLPSAPAIDAKIPSTAVKTKKQIPLTIVDSTIINRLIAERDSLAKLLTTQNVAISFSADTIHPVTHDTLSIECDELRRQINYSLHYAPRQEKITIRTETFIKEVTWWEKIFYGTIGFGIAELIHLFRK